MESVSRSESASQLLEQNIEAYGKSLIQQLVSTTKTANQLPADEDYQFQTAFGQFRDRCSSVGDRILKLTQRCVDTQLPNNSVHLSEATDADEAIDNFDAVVDVTDILVEGVDTLGDILDGSVAPPKATTSAVIATADSSSKKAAQPSSNQKAKSGNNYRMFLGSNVLRPQLKFQDAVDNSPTAFVPKIFYKPNAIISLHDVFKDFGGTEGQKARRESLMSSTFQSPHKGSAGIDINQDLESWPHPYEHEIDNFSFLQSQLKKREASTYSKLEDTAPVWIDALPDLKQLAEELDTATDFAIDLENHSYRSFHGFVCLMQISTRTTDYVIDTLPLRGSMHLLNSSFTNPKIVKVLHGCDSDVVWLQRDFGLYLVNVFDTGQAARVLEMPRYSLAYLLKAYCNFDADKQYQLADWRIRPLPAEMLSYAQSDTHFLLYIYDVLQNELIDRGNESNNLIMAVLNRSRDICKRKFEKEIYTPASHLKLVNRYNVSFTKDQMAVFATLYRWRDAIAREEDESTRYTLPNHMMFRIAERLPTSDDSLLACCSPVPPLLRLHSHDVVLAILNTLENPNPSTDLPSFPTEEQNSRDIKSPIHSAEQLCESAGWMDNMEVDTAAPKLHATCHPKNQDYLAFEPQQKSLFDTSSESEGGESEEDRRKVALVHQSFDSLPSLAPPFTATRRKAFPTRVGSSGKRISERLSTGSGSGSESEPGVPRSMAEIYKLSNKNRKKNKEKKKLKEGAFRHPPVSPVHFEEGTSSDDSASDKKHKLNAGDDPEQFMRRIGWIDEATPPHITHASGQPKRTLNRGHSRSRANSRGRSLPHSQQSQQFTPFDYNNKSDLTISNSPKSRHKPAHRQQKFYSQPPSARVHQRANLHPSSGSRTHTFRSAR